MSTAYITAPPAAAEAVARYLVTDRPAACVNRLPSRSTYRSDGGVHDDEAVLLLAKTTDDCYPDLVDRVERLHPHDVPWPCIERLEGRTPSPRPGRESGGDRAGSATTVMTTNRQVRP